MASRHCRRHFALEMLCDAHHELYLLSSDLSGNGIRTTVQTQRLAEFMWRDEVHIYNPDAMHAAAPSFSLCHLTFGLFDELSPNVANTHSDRHGDLRKDAW